ncbi:hypothetical protein BLS_004762 [Venturia inaequalis]|uniref:Uncharacterized protein n=1 Tax=Venturia inaequalis TaxID=5025 RepID=A0A8H3UHP0_VENIN|nr:hypothetical protein BLS_004762 [Venturia inaequalis]
MATPTQGWCREIQSEQWTDDREVDILGAYLDGTLTATEAAEGLTNYVDKRKTAATKVGRIWTLLQVCAVECADLHEQLIDLIKAMTACVPSKRTGGVDWTKQETSFKETWRESYDSLSTSLQDKIEYQRASNVPIAQRWTNYHAFSAQLATYAFFGNDFDVVSGLLVIVAALEKESPTKIICRDGQSMGAGCDLRSEKWVGKAGFSQKRWKFWKDRLEELQKSDAIGEKVRQLLRTATVAMGKAERAKK